VKISKQITSANVSKNGATAGFATSVTRELLQRRENGTEDKCNCHREKEIGEKTLHIVSHIQLT
jgi:hypothetical protein